MNKRCSSCPQTAEMARVSFSARGVLQRRCACGKFSLEGQCPSCKGNNNTLQRKLGCANRAAEIPPSVQQTLTSPGQPLNAAARAFFEPRLGQDFSQVRLHTDAQAVESARAVNALAYTVGQNVAFASGQYAPDTAHGTRLLAHELAHVAQQVSADSTAAQPARTVSDPSDPAEAEADHAAEQIMNGGRVTISQRPSAAIHALTDGESAGIGIGIGLGAIGAGLGIAWLAGAFDKTEFSDDELKTYLKMLEKGSIEGKTESDNKARAVVKRWQDGQAGFTILIVPTRVLLIKEMASGYLSEDDQIGILTLLKESIPSELNFILPKIGIDALKTRFDGEYRKQLDAIIENQEIETINFSADWTAQGVKKIIARHGDQSALKVIKDQGFKIIRFDQAFEKWEYADGSIKDEEIGGLQGNTSVAEKKIRLFKNMTDDVAASVLFHELDHVVSGVSGTEGEIHARIEGEKFGIRHGLPEHEKGYRKPDGTVDEAAIRTDIQGSTHYSPDPAVRHRVLGGRRYVGEVEVPGWDIP